MNIMTKILRFTVLGVGLWWAWEITPAAFAQTTEPVQAIKPVTATRQSLAIQYPEGANLGVRFQGTFRDPEATGMAKVERLKGTTRIHIDLEGLRPAAYFGGDYNTFVLWTVSPEGHVDNVGEFILEGNKSKLNVTTHLETFGMFVTAEPHFLVSSPSRFVVLENTVPKQNITGVMIKTAEITYRGYEGSYRFDRESLANFNRVKGETRSDLAQAETSIDLAMRAGADKYARNELAVAEEDLRKAREAAGVGLGKQNMMLMGHDVVRKAVAAQKLAEQRAFQAALDAERKAHADETTRLENSIKEAQSDAERARLEAQQRELQLNIEQQARDRAQKEAAEAARRAAEAEAQARQAEMQAQQLANEKQQLANEKTQAELATEQARAQLQKALSQVAETRETTRGLIVNLPDILFDFNKSTLRPEGREVLSKIAGILLVAKDYRMKLEGYTDIIGSDAYNLKLSQRRADSVHDYLAQAGISPDRMESVGFGKTNPVASNATAAGRQKNRRVEILIPNLQTPASGGNSPRNPGSGSFR